MTNGETDHLFDESHLDLCPECGKNPCECKPEPVQDYSSARFVPAPYHGPAKVNPAQLEKISEDCFVTEASSLGWQPGFWPRIFEMNGVLFVRQTGDAGSFLYEQSGGGILVEVFND
jgi:hypothetical protein